MLKSYSRVMCVVLILFVSGCAKYKPHSLAKKDMTVHVKNDVKIAIRPLADREVRKTFSRRALKHGLRAYGIFLENNGETDYIFNAADLKIDFVSRDEAYKALKLDSNPRLVGWSLAGVLVFPLFFIPAVVELNRCKHSNKTMKSDFDARVLDHGQKICLGKNASVSKVFFMKNYDVSSSIDVKINQETVSIKV